VARAIRAVRPFAVDAASGLESSPGVKDREKMALFVRAAQEASAP
jgi:phosphoribosylanthranilate isomerase